MIIRNNIMLIEDEQFLVRFYRTQLAQIGYRTVIVEDGKDAIAKANEELPDLIVLDMVLPTKNGFTILKELKANIDTKDIPVIVLTQLSQNTDTKEILELGAHKVLLKTETQINNLIEAVQNCLPLPIEPILS